MLPKISAAEALKGLSSGQFAPIDVRSSGEFAEGFIPGFHNRPILNNAERHQVGLCYRNEGQDAAIRLGHELVLPLKNARVTEWGELTEEAPQKAAIVTCWRGGLRSQITCQWMKERGLATHQVQGGYKAMRHELVKVFKELPPFLLIAGMTGSGKTLLLRAVEQAQVLDLELLAAHRGSAFGAFSLIPQPVQATFENAMGLSLRGLSGRVLVEDESAVIGSLHLPQDLKLAMQKAPVMFLESTVDDRAEAIYQEYVRAPQVMGHSTLQSQLTQSLQRLQRRLGGRLTAEITRDLDAAFAAEGDGHEAHLVWIAKLLNDYYDRAYQHAMERNPRTVVFRGTFKECQQWISQTS